MEMLLTLHEPVSSSENLPDAEKSESQWCFSSCPFCCILLFTGDASATDTVPAMWRGAGVLPGAQVCLANNES